MRLIFEQDKRAFMAKVKEMIHRGNTKSEQGQDNDFYLFLRDDEGSEGADYSSSRKRLADTLELELLQGQTRGADEEIVKPASKIQKKFVTPLKQ